MCDKTQRPIVATDEPGFFGIDNYGFPVNRDDPLDPPEYYPPYLDTEHFRTYRYHVEELRDGFYWVTSAGYDAAFVVTADGVIAIDAPPTIGENMVAAIESVTDKPVTHLIYSHWHTDHIGATPVYGPDVEIIAHEITKELLERFPDPNRPLPTVTFRDTYTLTVGGVTLELSYKGENHCPGNIFIYAPRSAVLTASTSSARAAPRSCTATPRRTSRAGTRPTPRSSSTTSTTSSAAITCTTAPTSR